jgi:hypothetical protein
MQLSAKSARHIKVCPTGKDFQREGDPGDICIITREESHTMKIFEINGGDRTITSKPKKPGETVAKPVFLLDIILPHLELLFFSGQVCKFLQGDPDCRRLDFRYQ